MKFKTTAIAMAVAGTVAAPVAVQAGADEIYASARVGVWNVNEGGNGDMEVRSFSSRFGARGETDLGNGLIGFGRYEWNVDMNSGSSISNRHRYVGLKGDFGKVTVGQTYHTFYNFVVGPTDIPWWHSGYAMIAYVGRTDKAITYSGGSDAFAFGTSLYFINDTEEQTSPDVWEVAGSYTFGNDMTIAVAARGTQADDNEGGDKGTLIGNGSDKTVWGGALSGIMLGDVGLGFGVQAQDDDTSFLIDATLSGFYVHIEAELLDKDSPANSSSNAAVPTANLATGVVSAVAQPDSVFGDDRDRVSYTLGYTQSLGRKTTAYYELNYIDNDADSSDDDRTAVMAVLKYDII